MRKQHPELERFFRRRNTDVFATYRDLMIQCFGYSTFYEDVFRRLGQLENGQCGVETTYFIYPALLLGQGRNVENLYSFV